MKKSILISVFVLALTAGTASAGFFNDTCNNIVLQGTVLKADCKTRDGKWVPAQIDLDPIVGYGRDYWYGASLKWVDNGYFSRACSNIRMENLTLKAECGYNKTTCDLYLRTGIDNDDGKLRRNP